jgi:predicted glycoside hydrolase/deacetylase ChbG (UPF0249 family)
MKYLIVTGDAFGITSGINRAMIQAHRSVDSLLRMLDAEVRDGLTELNCHPGYVEPGFPSSYAAEREEEVRTLCDSRVHHAIVERGIRLIGFRELPATASAASTTDRG